ncbi:MAG: type II toxin-antitoxin system VapC family toxin [Chloroflexi bacterium]|nr:type II toxin-antitoxin system VapC family toxin [Chloroflexota bacterium]
MENNPPEVISCMLDTDIAIDFLRRRQYVWKLIDQWVERGLVAVSAITHMEVYQGMRRKEEQVTNAFLEGLESIPVNVAVARKAGRLLADLRSKGVTIGIPDAIIAATALELDVPLLTNNVEHYPFKDLRVVRGVPLTQ